MSHTIDTSATRSNANEVKADSLVAVSGSTKDAGRVKFGGSGIRFTDAPASTKDAGRVRFGGSGIRF
jgi:hypothetical protein